ncbi:MAG TPA: cbb3-type cytochrome c oxidase subunit I [Candidatus Methylomirabilis sp.]|nr:cbb3-type cytochrome c oxidase subunit I [Candidatus Methylomirabilis sp.]
MYFSDFTLPVPDNGRRQLATGWLMLGLLSLLGSGVFSVLLVLSRTPYMQSVIPWLDFFHTALVVHVDLSVLVWFLAFGGALWSLNSTPRWLGVGRVALWLAAAGALVMAGAPFFGAGQPLMSNYVPVLQHPLFLAGLVIFAAGFGLLALRAMAAIPPVGPWMQGAAALRFGLNTAAVSAMLALIAFVWSYLTVPEYLHDKPYFEMLFWGGGHVLQFTYTLLMLVAWLWLASASGIRLAVSPRVALILFGFGLIAVFFTPIIYYAYPVTAVEHRKLFTWLMQYGGSLATLPLAVALLHGLWRGPRAESEAQPLRAALIASMILFGAGGAIGFLIRGTNVTIPAHYHGSIVGVTLAFMGLAYHLLPQLGYRAVEVKWARVQPWLYGGGQFLHVMGLVISGGYGVQRKVAGAEQALDSTGRVVGMGLMGIGGLIAIAGGFLFLYVCYRAMRPARVSRESSLV